MKIKAFYDKKLNKKPKCKRCGSDKGVIRSYGLNICRRCFREIASKLEFKKFDWKEVR